FFATTLISGCNSLLSQPKEEAVIIGKTEFPDPVREEIISLQQARKLDLLAEMESFPIQYRVRAHEDIIEDLQDLSNELRDQENGNT
ncbi:MAG: hypothetical protein AAGJ55_12940, partial [Cyanobacteria bacterium J06555_12]